MFGLFYFFFPQTSDFVDSALFAFVKLFSFIKSLMNAFYFCYTVFKILFKSAHFSDVSPSDHEPIGCI